ncbi:hypothetical protein CDAR_304681 [Caerostris darwini]|uniref:Uncharacterized protein n=1 Tax=Caerostris darwini TaxID=1538125 RepID=A0AAV4PRU9_9ARAC|nr:hypothetical protein CDAR_304681 [Caerostris darwini]
MGLLVGEKPSSPVITCLQGSSSSTTRPIRHHVRLLSSFISPPCWVPHFESPAFYTALWACSSFSVEQAEANNTRTSNHFISLWYKKRMNYNYSKCVPGGASQLGKRAMAPFFIVCQIGLLVGKKHSSRIITCLQGSFSPPTTRPIRHHADCSAASFRPMLGSSLLLKPCPPSLSSGLVLLYCRNNQKLITLTPETIFFLDREKKRRMDNYSAGRGLVFFVSGKIFVKCF